MFKKLLGLSTLLAVGVVGGLLGPAQPAAARSPKTLRGIAYTHTTPVRSRGTWYNWDKEIGANKIIVKKHQVKWYYRQHKQGKWHHEQTLTGKKLYVYHQTLKHKKMFGFYAAYEDDFNFFYTGTKKIHGKSVKYLSSAGIYTYYHAWKYAIR